jgi:hypothetical protein
MEDRRKAVEECTPEMYSLQPALLRFVLLSEPLFCIRSSNAFQLRRRSRRAPRRRIAPSGTGQRRAKISPTDARENWRKYRSRWRDWCATPRREHTGALRAHQFSSRARGEQNHTPSGVLNLLLTDLVTLPPAPLKCNRTINGAEGCGSVHARVFGPAKSRRPQQRHESSSTIAFQSPFLQAANQLPPECSNPRAAGRCIRILNSYFRLRTATTLSPEEGERDKQVVLAGALYRRDVGQCDSGTTLLVYDSGMRCWGAPARRGQAAAIMVFADNRGIISCFDLTGEALGLFAVLCDYQTEDSAIARVAYV